MAIEAKAGEPTTPPHSEARFAGLMYALVVATGVFSLAYATPRVFAGDTDAEIVRSVFANESLLRLSIVAELACYMSFIALALALYKLLSPAGQFAAQLMAAIAIVSVPFGFSNVTHLFDILRAVESQNPEAAQSLIVAAREQYRDGLVIQNIPWGAWLVPFGYLVFRCGFLPRVLGVLLILGGLGYVADFVGRVLFEARYTESILVEIFDAPSISEILICVWLLVFGARRTFLPQRRKADASAESAA
jgi:hypothetical protein